MKKIITSIALLIFSINCYAQTFQRGYDLCSPHLDFTKVGGKFIVEIDDGYLAFVQNHRFCLGISKLDFFGKEVLFKQLNLFPDSWITSLSKSLIRDKKGDFLLAGRVVSPGGLDEDVYLAKIDQNTLEPIWTKRYFLPGLQMPNSIKIKGDEIIILSQHLSFEIRQNGEAYRTDDDALFMKIDATGSLLDTAIISGVTHPFIKPGDFEFLPSGKIMTVYVNAVGGFIPRGEICLLNQNFEREWIKPFGQSQVEEGLTMPVMAVSPDSQVVYVSWTSQPDPMNLFGDHEGFIQAITEDQRVLWTLRLNAPQFILRSLDVDKEGNIYGGGFDFGARDDPEDRGRIFKISPQGNVIFDHRVLLPGSLLNHQATDKSRFYDILKTSDGGYIAIGDVEPPTNASTDENHNVYLVKLNKEGCLVASCDSIIDKMPAVSEVEVVDNENSGFLFPNPSNDKVFFQFPDKMREATFNLYSLAGKKVVDAELDRGDESVDISFLPKGIYFYKITTTDGEKIGQGKLVKQ